MPARHLGPIFIILLCAMGLPSVSTRSLPSLTPASALDSLVNQQLSQALLWLASNQQSDGSYGSYFEGQTAAAAYALWLNASDSMSTTTAYSNLTSQLDSLGSWFWGPYPEADVPGEVLYSVATTQHLSLLQNVSGVSGRLLALQRPNGGFEGYYDFSAGHSVTSAVDTAMALWGLVNAKVMPLANKTKAVDYLLSLQNPNGSFNLTETVPSDPAYSLGPDNASITALVTLALRDVSFTLNDPPVSRALDFLSQAASVNFTGPQHSYRILLGRTSSANASEPKNVFAASLSTLVFMTYHLPRDASKTLSYLQSLQNLDGGFRDSNRSSLGSNALDTGWATVALQLGMVGPSPAVVIIDHPPMASFDFSPRNPVLGVTVSFDGAASQDPDGDQLAYSWSFGDGFAATGVSVSHIYHTSANFTVILKVTETRTNSTQLSDTSWTTITVQPTQPPAARTPSLPFTHGIELVSFAIIAAALLIAYLVIRRSVRPHDARSRP